jgi:predicted RNase H-like HicB family nuclease
MSKYSMQLFWSDEDGEYVAVVPEFPLLSALANTPSEAASELTMVIDTVLEMLAERGEQAPEPQVLSSFSGQLRVRLPRTLHQRLAGRAKMEDVSLNTLIVSLLAEAIGAAEGLGAETRKTRRPKKTPSTKA